MKPKLLFGTGVSAAKNELELREIIECCIHNKICAFDTAPSYKTEQMLGGILSNLIKTDSVSRENLFIQTKVDGWQMQDARIEYFVKEALKKMQLEYLDSLLIHWPFPEYLKDTWSKMMLLKKQGYVRNIGICNLRLRNIVDLKTNGIIPDIVQIERNPLNIMADEMACLKEYDISVQAYSPLCKMDARIRDNIALQKIAEKYNKNIGQVVLRWSIDTGASPIFTTTKTSRVKEYAEIFDFCLNEEEIAQISSLNENYKLYLESFQCPGL